ncbi:unnamed protein product [Caenorhabditis sp. 36 PRJEB53466]|nr:unnamed protein product [Caenorhabditis sp. 36 PRJEB53466]
MESIASPLYFLSNLPLSPPSCTNVVRFIDVLEFFFIAHPSSGKKEGEEHNRIMYFHPKGENCERQTEVTGFAEAVVNFTENFLSSAKRESVVNFNDDDNFDFRTVSTQRTEHVYVRIEQNQFILGVSLSKQLCHVSDYPLFQPAVRSILCDAYKMFRMFFGTFSSFLNYSTIPDDIPKFKERLDFFFSKYIPLLKVHKMPLLDHLGGVEFLRMSGPLYLNVVSVLAELREEFPIVEKIMFLYQDKLLHYQLSKRDLPSLFRYLTHNLLPTSLAPELESSAGNASKGRYLRGPTDLTTDAPLLGDESLSVVHLHAEQDQDEEQLVAYQMIVYRCVNATVCMFVRHNSVTNGEKKTSEESSSSLSSLPRNRVVSRRLLRNIDQFLETELAQVASKIGDEIGDEKGPEATDFHYIYFNPSSMSMTSSLSTSPALSVAASGTTSNSKVPLPPMEVNRLVCDTMHNFVSETEESGECFVKSSSDWWIVVKKVNSRLLVLILPPSNYTSSLADVQSKTTTIVRLEELYKTTLACGVCKLKHLQFDETTMLRLSSQVFCLFLLHFTRVSQCVFLRVETGHQNIAIDGRDTYYGHYTKIYFHNVTCLDAIDIHCLKELTGAEEIDLLYSECQKGHWKVAHYTNSKHHFRLKEPIHAQLLLISSRRELSVIDVQVESCSNPPVRLLSECHRPTRNHNHRHGKFGQILRAVDPNGDDASAKEEQKLSVESEKENETRSRKRRKREISKNDVKIEVLNGSQEFAEDKVIPRGQMLKVDPGTRLRFHNNIGLVVNGILNIQGTADDPVILEPANSGERWRGIAFRDSPPDSILKYVNISGSDVAVSIKSGTPPLMDHVIADGNTYGIQIDQMDESSQTHLTSVVSANNEKTGIEYLGKGSISIDRTVVSSNGGLGIFITSEQKIVIRRSAANSNNGTGIYVGTSEVTLENVVVNGNGYYGIHAEVEKRFEIIVRACRFSRNAGEMIVMENYGNASLIVNKCSFASNIYLNFDNGDSVISLKNIKGSDNQLLISDCQFTKNSVSDVIKVLESAGSATSSSITDNDFIQNLANSAITTNAQNCIISRNQFEDRRSNCEVTYLLPATPKPHDLANNSFEIGDQTPFCTEKYNYFAAQMDEPKTTTLRALAQGITENPFEKSADGNQIISAQNEPYLINQEVMIDIGQTVVIEPGTILDFAPNTGITVAGRLVMNGTEERPVVVRGQNGNTWRGIVAKPEGVLDVINVVSEDASIGIWIDSEKVRVEKGRIVRPAVHGIEITQNSNDVVDLGGVVIEEANESAIGVDERRDDVLIMNAIVKDGIGTGIDFMTPTGNIELRNISIENMGKYGIHISEFPSSPLHAVLLDDVQIMNQKRGQAGILISGGWIQNIAMHNIEFSGNSVPSLIIAMECNDGNEKLIRLENCTFERNTDIVQHVQLGNCANLQMDNNRYTENNGDGIGSTLVITSDKSTKKKNGVMELAKNNFTANGGIYTVTLDSNVHDVYFTDNMLTANENSGAVLKISGENAKIVTNYFDNRESKYQVAYSDDYPIDARFNEWNGLSEEEVLETIDAKEGSVRVIPYGTPTVSVDNQLDAVTTLFPVTVSDYENAQCAHLSYCSRRGTCRDGICVCPHGFAGFDCSIQLICNCSGNGLCNLLNICLCNEGWTGSDCSIPNCAANCNGHGKCVGPNSCECARGWMGDSCATTSCVDSECLHGHCGSNGLCLCENGWQGSRCQVSACSNCSLNGKCSAPGICSCFEDYGGADCTQCVGDSCEACDFDCNHGICEPLTKTCSCSKGWTGGACDVCSIGKCNEAMRIFYIQPSTAELEDVNAVVNVFGDGFSTTDNNSYVCTFGRTTVTGLRISSAIIRCPIPSNLTLGRHVFSVSQPGSFSSIDNSEAKPIHFTLYDGCEPSLCQGSCIGPLCICPQGKTGIFCDVIEILPSIDKRFLEHQRANQAFEGLPYVLMLPTMSSSVLRVNSTIPHLNFIASKGIIAWPEPLGSQDPYEITVTAFSPAGKTTIAWNVTVAPEYAVEVRNVTVEAGKATIYGKLIGPSKRAKRPVVIRIQRDNVVDEILAESDDSGDVNFDYIPMLPGTFEVSMAHPNVNTDSITRPIRFTIPEINLPIHGESSNSSLTLDIAGRHDCRVKLLQPRVEGADVEQRGTQNIINFGRFWSEEVVAAVTCGNESTEIVRAPAIETGLVSTTPEVLSLYGNEHLYEVKVHAPMRSLLTLDVDVSGDSLQYLSAIPEAQYLRLTFATSSSVPPTNGTIQVNDGAKPLSTIPFFYVADNKSTYYNFKICIRDEWDGQEGPLASSEVATIAVQNLQRGVDVIKPNVRLNVQWADFTLQPGLYKLLIKSDLHESVEEVVELTPLNATFCVAMTSTKSRNVPSIYCTHSTDPDSCDVKITSATSSSLPYLHFEPSVVTSKGQKVLVEPRGNLKGTVGLWNSQLDGVSITPSRRSVAINESFWITFDWEGSAFSCSVLALNVPFIFLPTASDIPLHTRSTILIRQSRDGNDVCSSSKDAPPKLATSTMVMCNCGDGARARCREKYHSATACGSAWSKIADDTVSLEVLAAFLSMIFECKEVSVSFEELRSSLECVASIESDCPVNSMQFKKRKRQAQTQAPQADSPFGILSQLGPLNSDFGKVLPVLNALDVQTIRISSVFIELVDRIQKLFPADITSSMDKETVDHFIGAISDSSDEGMMISEAERRIIGDSALRLIQLWNLTVKSWKSGKVQAEKLGISHQEAKLLVSAADKVKSISRQNVAQDPFSMLHGYMERMLETGETEQRECATTTVLIDEKQVEEDGQIRIQVFIHNRANVTLTNIGVSLSLVKSHIKTPSVEFNIGPSWSAGIGSLTGLGTLAAGSSFEIHWTRFVSVPRRLTTIARYQPIIIFSYSSIGRLSQQKLFAPEISVIPKKTVRAINIIKDDLSPKDVSPNDFSIISSIINPGYTTLKSVQIQMSNLAFSGASLVSSGAPTRLESVFVNGKLSHKSLTQNFDEIRSGSTKFVRVLMKEADDVVPVTFMNLTVLEEGKLLTLDSMETYAIRAAGISDFGMLLATPQQEAPLFYFRPSAAQMVNVIKLEFLSIRLVNSSSTDRTSYVVAFRNPESASFGGAFWARMPTPEVGDNHKLTTIVDRGGARPRELQALQWISPENNREMLNWIDAATLSSRSQMIYELQFTNPDAKTSENPSDPQFDQFEYRIEMAPGHLAPDSEIGLIEADGDDLTYFLYSPDNDRRFSVDSETGRIFFDSDEPLKDGQEYCVVLEARDAQGRSSRVPVAINNGGARQECVLFSTVGLTPIIHFGTYIPTPTLFTLRTRIYTTTQPTTLAATTSTSLFPSLIETSTGAPVSQSTGSSSEASTIPTKTSDMTTSSVSSEEPTLSPAVITPSESLWTSTENPHTSPEASETTATTITFLDSTLEPITTAIPIVTTTSESVGTSSEDSTLVSTPERLETTTSLSEGTSEVTSTLSVLETSSTTLEFSESTLPSEYFTSERTSTMQPITDFPTPPDATVTETTSTAPDFPTPPDYGTRTTSSDSGTLEPILSTSTESFPTPPDAFTYPTSSESTTLITWPDSTLSTLTVSSSIVSSTASPEMYPTSESTLEPIWSSSTLNYPELTSTRAWISTTSSSLESTTAEVTKILPTDPSTSTTTEIIYTMSSDATLEPVTDTSETSTSLATSTDPVYTVSPDFSPVTDATWQPPVHASTSGGVDGYSTSSPATVATTTPAPTEDIECVPDTAFSRIICDILGVSRRRQRSQF